MAAHRYAVSSSPETDGATHHQERAARDARSDTRLPFAEAFEAQLRPAAPIADGVRETIGAFRRVAGH